MFLLNVINLFMLVRYEMTIHLTQLEVCDVSGAKVSNCNVVVPNVNICPAYLSFYCACCLLLSLEY